MGASGAGLDLGREGGLTGFHLETLSNAQREVLCPLSEFAVSEGFYLGGGTAVALHLGHRRSADFAWFRPADIEDPLVLAQQIRGRGLVVEEVQVAAGTLHAVIAGGQVSFLVYPYGLLSAPHRWDDPPLAVASLEDLAPMKLAAVAQRGARKDFVDLYAMALQYRPLENLLALYRKKYSVADVAHVLTALTYFDSAEEEPPPTMLWDTSWETVKRSFEEWVRSLAS